MVVNEKEYKKHLNAAHTAIESGYASAIDNYNRQKENFKTLLGLETTKAEEEFLQKVNDAVSNETPQHLEILFNRIYSEVKNYVESFIVSTMDGKTTGEAELRTRFKDLVERGNLAEGVKGRVNPKNIYENMKKDIEKFLTDNLITRSSLSNYISSRLPGFNSNNNTDIANNLYGYARKLILAELQGRELKDVQITHLRQSLKGYYSEELLVPALVKVLQQYNKNIGAKQSGSMRNAKGQQIQIDILLGHVKSLSKTDDEISKMLSDIPTLVNGESSIDMYEPNIYGGIQSKSWFAPWEQVPSGIKGNQSWLSFGSHAELLPEGDDLYYWHAGATNVMNNLVSVVGDNNFMFSTGGRLYFTANLLARLKEESYVLAFYKRQDKGNEKGKIESPDVGAMEHTV